MKRSGRSWKRFQYLQKARTGFSTRARKVERATITHARHFVVGRWRNLYEVRKSIALWVLGVGVLILAMLVHFLLLRSGYAETAPVRGGTYAEGVVGKITTLNPLYATSPAEQSVSKLLFSSLFRYDDTGALSGDLATGYQVDGTGRNYTVSLHKKAYWHDGKPVTVDDILFTIETIKKPSSGAVQSASWKGIEAKRINDVTIMFTLPAAYAPFPHALTFPVLPKHLLADTPANLLRESRFSVAPVGSGPFSFVLLQRVKGDQHSAVHLARNATYHGGASKLERFQVHAYETTDLLRDAFKQQAVNAASGIAASDMTAVSGDGRVATHAVPLNSAVYAIFNTSSGILKDTQVRQAVQAGTQVDKVLQQLPYRPQRLDLPFIPAQVKGAQDIKPVAHNQQAAKELLDKAGWQMSGSVRKKGEESLTLRMAHIKDGEYKVVAEQLAEQWKQLGIEVQLREIDTSDPTQNFASTVLQPRDYDVLLHELSLGADPDVYAYWHSTQAVARGLNFANYTDDISDDALASGRSRADKGLRDAKYRAFAQKWLQQAPAIGLYRSSLLYATRGGGRSVDANMRFVSPADRYADVQYWTVRTDGVYKTP